MSLPPSPDEGRWPLLGVAVHAVTMDELHDLMARALSTGEQITIVSQNAHGVYSYHRNPFMQDLHRRSYVRIDGIPLLWWGRALGYPFNKSHRMGWVDWMPGFLRMAGSAGWKVYYLGGPPGVAEQGVAELSSAHPAIFVGTHHGHFDQRSGSDENSAVIASINSVKPDVLMVGMGMPRQERWVLANAEVLQVPVIVTCGAAIEYFAGTMETPPRWLGNVGLEWLYRLIKEPRRLGFRYLVETWSLIPLIIMDVARRVWRNAPTEGRHLHTRAML
jgi:N-acetylglucosaminyldiphosphoundecaprenol N-acetyl-beta-D-mannosaminyltransferase